MILELRRDAGTADRTFGTLWIEGVKFCDTLEPARQALDPLEDFPAIPSGRYRVTIYYSLRHKSMVPLLHDVPGRTYIEIHIGNVVGGEHTDSRGCILVGESRLGDALLHSRDAFNALMPKLAPVLAAQQDVWIDVREPK